MSTRTTRKVVFTFEAEVCSSFEEDAKSIMAMEALKVLQTDTRVIAAAVSGFRFGDAEIVRQRHALRVLEERW